MGSLISIVVPFYNTPKEYLDRCLESLCSQVYSNIEILIVDDGSTIENANMLDSATASDSRMMVFHKPNGGVSTARNYALARATGDYVCFVDSDDWVEPEFIQTLVDSIEKNESQLAVCNWVAESTKRGTIIDKGQEKTECYNQGEAYHAILCYTAIQGFLCNKMFKKHLITQLLNENYHYCEDLVFVSHYLKRVNKMSYSSLQLYHYRQTGGNATSNFTYNEKILTLLPAYQEVESIYKELRLTDVPLIEKSILKIALNLRARYKLNKARDIESFKKNETVIEKYLGRNLISANISIAEKINIILTWMMPVLMFRIKCKLLKRSI